jgi:uncharacterized protein
MKIEIIGAESLGVRGLCCFVTAGEHKILIDPGIALGLFRRGLAPHPAQVAVGEVIRKKIIQTWGHATDIVFSHFHGDHVPLVDANPYQLDADRVSKLNPGVRIWTKSPDFLTATERKRSAALKERLDARWQDWTTAAGLLRFSVPVPHGEKTARNENVIMTRIEDDMVFVHTSDIQLLDDDTVDLVREWQPDILLAGGPPLYLGQLSSKLRNRAWQNAVRLAGSVDILILDHHLMRSLEGLQWLDRLSSESGRRVLCAADFMGAPRRLLEAQRKMLYEKTPVPLSWHQDYAENKADTKGFQARLASNVTHVESTVSLTGKKIRIESKHDKTGYCSECSSACGPEEQFIIEDRPVCRKCLFGNGLPVTIYPIGIVKNNFERDQTPFGRRGTDTISKIELLPSQKRFMAGLEQEPDLTIVYYLHKSRSVKTSFPRGIDGKQVGVFASRTPDRLSRI